MLEGEALIAEHGLSLLLTVERDGDRATVLYDAGLGAGTASTTWTSCRSGWPTSARSSSPTGTPTTTGAWRACCAGPARAACRS